MTDLGRVAYEAVKEKDMVPWAELPEDKRAKYRAMGEAGAAVERGRWVEAARKVALIRRVEGPGMLLDNAIVALEAIAQEQES